MRITAFLDLDDTIFQTLPKCPAGVAVHPVAFRRDGAPLSFMTDRQRALVHWLLQTAAVIPTTARNLDAFRRVALPFQGFAILDFGGVILLPDGRLDPSWDAQIRPRALEIGPELTARRQAVQDWSAELDLGVNVRVIEDFGLPLYLVVKHPDGKVAKLRPVRERLAASLDPTRFFLHSNDNNLSLVPRFLGKERAVRHIMESHLGPEPALTLGIGDSWTDAPFLDVCDFRVTPRDCQLTRHNADGHGAATL